MNNPPLRLVEPNQSYTSQGSGEPPNGGHMDLTARVGNLELDMKDVRERTIRIESRLDHIDREVSNTKWWVIGSTLTIILTVIATVVATSISIQQMTVTTFQAAGENASKAATPTAQPAPIIINIPPQDQSKK